MGAVFAELFDFVVFEDAEGFAGEVGAVDVAGVEDVAEFVAGEAVEVGVVGVEFGAEVGTTVWVPGEGGKWGVGSGVRTPYDCLLPIPDSRILGSRVRTLHDSRFPIAYSLSQCRVLCTYLLQRVGDPRRCR